MPLVFAAAMGGNISLIGAPGNMIAQAGLQQAGLGSFGFFDYGLVGFTNPYRRHYILCYNW